MEPERKENKPRTSELEGTLKLSALLHLLEVEAYGLLPGTKQTLQNGD